MGYTHYYNLKSKASKKKWNEFVGECNILHNSLDHVAIKDGSGDTNTKPIFNTEAVCFNGDEVDDLCHETFYLDQNSTEFNFCKTARKPYDLMVMACLIAANKTMGLLFKSDGFNNDGTVDQEMIDGINFYNETVKPKNKITGDPDPVTEDELWLIRKKYNNQR